MVKKLPELEVETAAVEAPAITARYLGQGDFWPGVPARDLTVDEWQALPEAVRQACLASRLYEPVEA